MKWMYNGKEFKDSDIPEGAHGFIYSIKIKIDGILKYYIGKKNFHSVRNVKKGKGELEAMVDKRGSKKKQIVKLDYQNYCSSNKAIQEAIKNGVEYEKVILHICFSKMELTYQETKHLFSYSVLEDERFLNDNILGKFYRKSLNS